MKKILLTILLILLFTKNVVAEADNNISKVLYKWYQEEKEDSLFYPKSQELPNYIEEENNIQYGEYSDWDNKYCSYSSEYYLIEEKNITKYEELLKTKYIELTSIYNVGSSDDFNIIKIYYDNNEISYKVIEYSTYIIRIELEEEYDTAKLEFYIDTGDIRYHIRLANDINYKKTTVSYWVYPNVSGKRLIWNEDWISEKSTFEAKESENVIEKTKSIRNITNETRCHIREINTYRYKVKRKYYDNDYHIYINGYIPDITDRIIYYDDVQLKEVETQYTKGENNESTLNTQENVEENIKTTSMQKNNSINIKTHIVEKIPKKIYIVIIILIIVIIFQEIKIISKKVG